MSKVCYRVSYFKKGFHSKVYENFNDAVNAFASIGFKYSPHILKVLR